MKHVTCCGSSARVPSDKSNIQTTQLCQQLLNELGTARK